MAGVWHFSKEGVARLEAGGGVQSKLGTLVYRPTNQVINSYAELEVRLAALGWMRLQPAQQPGVVQFHKGPACNHLITLPSDFRSLKPMHLLDIAFKNRDLFEVRDLTH
ncbi:hypothetical protein GOP47_0008902 [Adiantum capillus-veneris]|uniref:Uncharacterized protein n=1 Tax=Adiantum capillus-veneris TaxID=13818 RepID=A0A9D4ZK58_ADICA|nr:hypothetical protein GOP47_0008902 [Adiantum capillus-veneris]